METKKNSPNGIVYRYKDAPVASVMGWPRIGTYTFVYAWAPEIFLKHVVVLASGKRYVNPPKGKWTIPEWLLADVAVELGFGVRDVLDLMGGRPYRL